MSWPTWIPPQCTLSPCKVSNGTCPQQLSHRCRASSNPSKSCRCCACQRHCSPSSISFAKPVHQLHPKASLSLQRDPFHPWRCWTCRGFRLVQIHREGSTKTRRRLDLGMPRKKWSQIPCWDGSFWLNHSRKSPQTEEKQPWHFLPWHLSLYGQAWTALLLPWMGKNPSGHFCAEICLPHWNPQSPSPCGDWRTWPFQWAPWLSLRQQKQLFWCTEWNMKIGCKTWILTWDQKWSSLWRTFESVWWFGNKISWPNENVSWIFFMNSIQSDAPLLKQKYTHQSRSMDINWELQSCCVKMVAEKEQHCAVKIGNYSIWWAINKVAERLYKRQK